tara:strand:- start:1215 stop:1655 length:441 start_codon:yes stop_codon:yes gene_type:complete
MGEEDVLRSNDPRVLLKDYIDGDETYSREHVVEYRFVPDDTTKDIIKLSEDEVILLIEFWHGVDDHLKRYNWRERSGMESIFKEEANMMEMLMRRDVGLIELNQDHVDPDSYQISDLARNGKYEAVMDQNRAKQLHRLLLPPVTGS